jgi:hypothetical protein
MSELISYFSISSDFSSPPLLTLVQSQVLEYIAGPILLGPAFFSLNFKEWTAKKN